MFGFGAELGKLNSKPRTDFYLKYISQPMLGLCEFSVGETCQATSTYLSKTANNVGIVSYTWVVTGATIASGQGTDSITVITDSDTSDAFSVQCTVNDTITSDTKAYDYTHNRTEEVVYSSSITIAPNPVVFNYDSSLTTAISSITVSPNPIVFNYDSTVVANPTAITISPNPIVFNYSSELPSQVVDTVLSSGVRVIDVGAYSTERSKTNTQYLADEFDKIIPSVMTATDNEIFDVFAYDNTNSYNPISAELDFSGVGLGKPQCGTLVTSQNIILANHYALGVGQTIDFRQVDGTFVRRTVSDFRSLNNHALIGDSDAMVLKLDSPVPSGVKVYPILARSGISDVDLIGSKTIATNQYQQMWPTECTAIKSAGTTYPETNGFVYGATSGYTNIGTVGGDSGNPLFTIVNGEMVLCTAIFATEAQGTYGPNYGHADMLTALNDYINEMDV